MHVTNLTSDEIEPRPCPRRGSTWRCARQATPRLETFPGGRYFRAGFLGYVAGSQKSALACRAASSPEIIGLRRWRSDSLGKAQTAATDQLFSSGAGVIDMP